MSEVFLAATESDMLALGQVLADRFKSGACVYLSGDLGMGKTTLVRGIIRAIGFEGRVKSPSYGLVETYELPDLMVHHLDLYRLSHGEELAFLGLEDLMTSSALVLIEWPERGQGFLPQPDWTLTITEPAQGGREIELERQGQ